MPVNNCVGDILVSVTKECWPKPPHFVSKIRHQHRWSPTASQEQDINFVGIGIIRDEFSPIVDPYDATPIFEVLGFGFKLKLLTIKKLSCRIYKDTIKLDKDTIKLSNLVISGKHK